MLSPTLGYGSIGLAQRVLLQPDVFTDIPSFVYIMNIVVYSLLVTPQPWYICSSTIYLVCSISIRCVCAMILYTTTQPCVWRWNRVN